MIIWHGPLGKAWFCVGCDRVLLPDDDGGAERVERCPACGSGVVLPLARWMPGVYEDMYS